MCVGNIAEQALPVYRDWARRSGSKAESQARFSFHLANCATRSIAFRHGLLRNTLRRLPDQAPRTQQSIDAPDGRRATADVGWVDAHNGSLAARSHWILEQSRASQILTHFRVYASSERTGHARDPPPTRCSLPNRSVLQGYTRINTRPSPCVLVGLCRGSTRSRAFDAVRGKASTASLSRRFARTR